MHYVADQWRRSTTRLVVADKVILAIHSTPHSTESKLYSCSKKSSNASTAATFSSEKQKHVQQQKRCSRCSQKILKTKC